MLHVVFSSKSQQEAYLLFVQRTNVVIIAVVVCLANLRYHAEARGTYCLQLRVLLATFLDHKKSSIIGSFVRNKVVNRNKKPWRNDDGFVIMGMKYFFLNADSLEF